MSGIEHEKKRVNSPEADRRIFAAKYFDGYEEQSLPKKNGKGWHTVRVYVSDAYEPTGGNTRLNRIKLRITILILVFFLFMLLGGTRRSPVNTSTLAMLPYAVSLIAGAYSLVGIVRLLFSRGHMTKYSYKRYCEEVGNGTPAAAAGALLAAVAALFLWFQTGLLTGDCLDYLIPILSFLLSAAAAYGIRSQYRCLPFNEIKGRTPYEDQEREE